MTRTILIVDDDPVIRMLITTTLQDVSGYRLEEAGDGMQALEAAQREQPEIVFLDYDMPRLNGIETCRRLRSDPVTAGATIIMLTGMSDAPARPAPTCTSRSRSRRCGCCAWWTRSGRRRDRLRAP